MSIQNSHKVEYKIYFNLSQLNEDDVKEFMETIGVDIQAQQIHEDLDQIVVKFVALYCWKLVVMDRAFIKGATMIFVGRV